MSYDWDTVSIYGLGSYCVIFGAWASVCAPFVILDHFQLAQRYRIQTAPDGGPPTAATSPHVRRTAVKMVMINWAWMLPTIILASPLLRKLFPVEASAPPLWQAPIITVIWFLMHDMSFYCYHRLLHEVPWLYVRFHKPHHLFTAPFAWTGHATHPVEMALQSVGALAGPVTWSFAFGLPLQVWWAWLVLIQLQGILDHTGYDFPTPFDFSVLPGFGGTRFHDDHHKYYNCNYAAVFSAIDTFMGTTRSQLLEKKKMKD